MNLNEIRTSIIRSAQHRLNRHRVMGNKTKLSVLQAAELMDIVSGMAEEARVQPEDLIGNISLN